MPGSFMLWRAGAARRLPPQGQEGFLLPLAMNVALLLMLSSLMLLTLALQSRLQAAVQHQRRLAEDQLMNAAQQWAGRVQRGCPQALAGEPLCAGLEAGEDYRVVSYAQGGSSQQESPDQGTGELVLELSSRDPAPRAAFALHWIVEPPQLVGIEERGLRASAAAAGEEVAP
jgi:hypothetical protein